MSSQPSKLPRVMFYPVLPGDSDNWRVLAHCPGLPYKCISEFASKADAEAWAFGPEAQAWIGANYQCGE